VKPLPGGTIPPHHPNCFGCGPDNPAGLGLRMRVDGDRVRATLTIDRRHEGAPGLAHGGAVAAALDDLLGGVLVMLGRPAVTANLSIDFRAPVLLGQPLELAGWCASANGRKLELHAEAHAGDQLVAEAQALFLEVDIEHFLQAGAPLPDNWDAWAT